MSLTTRRRISANRRVRIDLAIGVTLLGIVIVARLLSEMASLGLGNPLGAL